MLLPSCPSLLLFFFFNDPATTEIYTLSLHDALPIYLHPRSLGKWTNDPDSWWRRRCGRLCRPIGIACRRHGHCHRQRPRSEEHTSELQSHSDLVCRLLLEKKKKQKHQNKVKIKMQGR